MSKGKILLHICCGPCAIYPVQELRHQGFEVVGLYYNPNIHPLQEYLRRRQGVMQVAEHLQMRVIFKDDEYDPSTYLRKIVFRENHRCFLCVHLRLERAFSIAKRGDFGFFTTTLLYSKFQNHDQIAKLGKEISIGSKLCFLYQDFREGWQQGIKISKEWGIYRQQYCGCIYSEKERYYKELKKVLRS